MNALHSSLRALHHAGSRSALAHVARDLASALNFFRDPPGDGLVMQLEENMEVCHKSRACAVAATVLQFLLSFLLVLVTILFTKDSIMALSTAPILTPMSASLPLVSGVEAPCPTH